MCTVQGTACLRLMNYSERKGQRQSNRTGKNMPRAQKDRRDVRCYFAIVIFVHAEWRRRVSGISKQEELQCQLIALN